VTTQLRLVEAPQRRKADRAPGTRRASTTKRSTKASTTRAPASRRAANWGDWQLDAQTRRVGRAGVAAARKALDEARQARELPRAS
jgi:hypothetical protein